MDKDSEKVTMRYQKDSALKLYECPYNEAVL